MTAEFIPVRLADLFDVDLDGIEDGDTFAWDADAGKFVAVAGGGGSNVFVQADDPGAVGAGKIWVDNSNDDPILNLRSDDNARWEPQGIPFNEPVDMNQGASVTGQSRSQEVFRAYASGIGSTLDVDFDSGATATFEASSPGAQGDSITITLVKPGANNPVATSAAVGTDVTVTLATDSGGDVTSLVSDVATAIVNDADSAALISIAAWSDGLVNELSQTPLAGGQDPLFAWWVAPDGQEAFAATDEVADEDVAPGQRFHNYDATPGANGLRYKQADSDGTITKGRSLGLSDTGVLNLSGLPTADPHVAGHAYTDSGVVKVSVG